MVVIYLYLKFIVLGSECIVDASERAHAAETCLRCILFRDGTLPAECTGQGAALSAVCPDRAAQQRHRTRYASSSTLR